MNQQWPHLIIPIRWADSHVVLEPVYNGKGKNMGHGSWAGFINIPLASEFRPFSLRKKGNPVVSFGSLESSRSLWSSSPLKDNPVRAATCLRVYNGSKARLGFVNRVTVRIGPLFQMTTWSVFYIEASFLHRSERFADGYPSRKPCEARKP